MTFITRKRRQPPAVIIISLVDILVVLLIFLMVTTTFRRQPAVKLALPQSKQKKSGSSETAGLIVTIAEKEPYLYLEARPLTLTKLQEELTKRAAANPKVNLQIRADAKAPWQQIVYVMEAAKAAKITDVGAQIKAGQ